MNIKANKGENIWTFVKRAKGIIIHAGIDSARCEFDNVKFDIFYDSRDDDSVNIYALKGLIKKIESGLIKI